MLVIHVGPHKTATTYIQHYLYRNARRLGRQGWTYPEIEGAVISDAHHDLAHRADAYLEKGTPQNDMLRGWADVGPNLLLSAEGFRMWDADRFDRLADVLGATDYVLVFALREPISALWSYWAEEIKQGQTIPLAEKFGRFACNPMTSYLMNACIDFERYRESPRAGLRVMPFDLLVEDGVDIAAHMVEVVLGLSTEGFAVPRRANERIPIELTEFLRLISILRSGGARAAGSAFRLAFMRHISPDDRRHVIETMRDHARPARRAVGFSHRPDFLDPLKARIREQAKDAWTYDVDGREIFAEPKLQSPSYNAALALQIPEVRAELDRVIALIEPHLKD